MLRSLSESIDRFVETKEAAGRRLFVETCRRWKELVGPVMGELVRPLGHRRRELLLGADDPVAMQEMVFAAPEILARINAALGHDAFDKVRFDLLGSQVSLDAAQTEPPRFSTPPTTRPAHLGGLAGEFDPVSPVGRCYAKYVAFFEAGPKPSGKASRGRRRLKTPGGR